MTDQLEIKGGATEFEAAVLAAVVDRITEDERLAREGRRRRRALSAWMRAVRPEESGLPPQAPGPDPR